MNRPASAQADLALETAERQHALLGELAALGMAVCRASAAASVAASGEVEAVVANTAWQSQQDRTLAMAGAKAAAEAFQKVSRSLRLTLVLEAAVAGTIHDLRAGIVRPARSIVPPALAVFFGDEPPSSAEPARTEGEDRATRLERPNADREKLFDIESPDHIRRAPFRKIVDELADDLEATIDWNSGAVVARDITQTERTPRDPPVLADRETALSP